MTPDPVLLHKLRAITRDFIVIQLQHLTELGELSKISPSRLGAFMNGARDLASEEAYELARSLAAIALVRPFTERGRVWLNEVRQQYFPQLPFVAPPMRASVSSVPAGFGFDLTIDDDLTPEQITDAMDALADFFREIGGSGLLIEFETQDVHSPELVYA